MKTISNNLIKKTAYHLMALLMSLSILTLQSCGDDKEEDMPANNPDVTFELESEVNNSPTTTVTTSTTKTTTVTGDKQATVTTDGAEKVTPTPKKNAHVKVGVTYTCDDDVNTEYVLQEPGTKGRLCYVTEHVPATGLLGWDNNATTEDTISAQNERDYCRDRLAEIIKEKDCVAEESSEEDN